MENKQTVYAAIIKHPFRDFDWRIDVHVTDKNAEELRKDIELKMLGPFQIIALVSERFDYRQLTTQFESELQSLKAENDKLRHENEECAIKTEMVRDTHDLESQVSELREALKWAIERIDTTPFGSISRQRFTNACAILAKTEPK